MDSVAYQDILSRFLLPFVHNKYPEGYRFMQDNDPKHTSRSTLQWIERNEVNWWRTPPESPVSSIVFFFVLWSIHYWLVKYHKASQNITLNGNHG